MRSLYAAWARGDFSSTDWADPDIEYVQVDGPTPGTWRGVPAMGRAWGEAIAEFAEFHVEAEEIRPVGEDRFLVLTHNTGRGRTSGFALDEIATRGANVLHVRDGKVTRLALYFDRDRAIEDLEGGER